MLIDNKINQGSDEAPLKTVWQFIQMFSGKESGQKGSLDIVTGYFTIQALSKLYEEFPEDTPFRIISSEMAGNDFKKDQIVNLLSDAIDLSSLGNIDKMSQQAIAFLERSTVDMRAEFPDFCHAKAYLFKNANPLGMGYYVSGSSNLTPAGLGLKEYPNIELNIAKRIDNKEVEYKELEEWFKKSWEGARKDIPEDLEDKRRNAPTISVKEYFIRKIRQYFREYTPEEIYYKILFELFNADIDLDASLEHKQDMSLLQTSAVWNTLYDFQKKGVISLIKMLRKYNGAILADAVGLGKTFSALAVIKYFQTQGYMTLMLCPKKLEGNWTQYLKHHGSCFDRDDFEYKVRFHTDLQDDRLQKAYDDASLDYLQKRQKLLIVIDESHNLRNEKSSRYKELIDSLIKRRDENDNREVKVLMLSATPINTGLADIKGQFNLIGRDSDSAFDNEDFGVESMTNLFSDGQKKYTTWCKDDDRTIGGFVSMLPQKFFNLTDKLIVARTRKMIEKTLGEDLHFPKKEAPINVYQGVDHFGEFTSTEAIYKAFEDLTLTAYQPSKFIPETIITDLKGQKLSWQDDLFREQFLVKMMGILFMKRLESSWYSCMLTVKKVLDIHVSTLAMVEAFKEKKAAGLIDVAAEDMDDDMLEEFTMFRKKDTVCLADMKNLEGFEKGLRSDITKLRRIYNALQNYKEDYLAGIEKDLKLNELQKILANKKKQANKKIVIFTVYADTANFIFDELLKRGCKKMAMVSGTETRTTGHHSTKDYREVLMSFAPYSKLYVEKEWSYLYENAHLSMKKYYDDEKHRWNVPYDLWLQLLRESNDKTLRLIDDGIDILIATDCLSEGQNLQDADMQVNYDIHWNPVRLIQRFGRIDRLKSPCETIRSVNFWPAASFEEYLNLETRVTNRMAIMNITGAETQELNPKYLKILQDNTLADKNAARLLKELSENSISDIEDSQSLSLTDLSMEAFRQDLVDFYDKNRELFENIPNGVFSGFSLPEDFKEQMPESLIAVVGYPHRVRKDQPYTNIYLLCQPVDSSAQVQYRELNQIDVLDFLRKNKKACRFVPDMIQTAEPEQLERLSTIMKLWLRSRCKLEGASNTQNILKSRKTIKQKPSMAENTAEKFQLQNFDLIVWEYISK